MNNRNIIDGSRGVGKLPSWQSLSRATWAYGDGIISNTLALTHTHTYTQAGVYSVTLSVGDGVITDTLTRTRYITVTGGTAYTTTTRVITYTYDPFYRLTGADYRSTRLTAGSSGESFEYGYDAPGNRAIHTHPPLKAICFCKPIVLG